MKNLKKLYTKIKKKLGRKQADVYWFGVFVSRFSRQRNVKHSSRPSVWLDIHDNYERYVYLLTKLFELEGYQVIMRPNLKFIFSFGEHYQRQILSENKVLFSKTKPPKAVAVFSDRMSKRKIGKVISKDYFSTIYDQDDNSYHIPIGLHPAMYGTGLWNQAIEPVERKRAIFFAGRFNEDEYKRLVTKGKFKMLGRMQLLKLLKTLPNATFPESMDELLGNSKNGQIDIVEKADFKVPNTMLRQTIARYSFFIACPGVAMPLAHNIYEAMSVGTIPIIHKDYAQMFHPALADYTNAILYDNDNFIEKLNEVVQIDQEKVNAMVAEVTKYYNAYLTPKAIVRHLISTKNKFFLNAERASVKVMR